MLCDRCKQFCGDVLTGAIDQGAWHPSSLGLPQCREFLFTNMGKAQKFAASGHCGLCSLIYESYCAVEMTGGFFAFGNNRQDQLLAKDQLTASLFVPGPTTKHVYRPWQFRLEEPYISFEFCFLDRLKRHPQAEITHLDITIAKCVEPHIGTEVEDYAGSDSVCALARRWTSNCLSNHARCHSRGHQKLLPRRLVDVGEMNSEGSWSRPRIVQPNAQYGYYAALSYRWSAVGTQFCTTRENLADLMRFIPLWLLPRTMQDAIVFCRRLGYRYLWVDSLCIIQGDDDDWNEACHGMASIFENSHLTISALQSNDSHAGLFHHRTYIDLSNLVCLRVRDGRLLTMRYSNLDHELHLAVQYSPMTFRGWIMQEKLLSPAIAHFSNHGLYWECKSSTVSELFANAEIPATGVLKNILSEIRRPGCSDYPGGHFIAWYMIMSYYSHKSLTFETDRLPAILGLVSRFQTMFSTTFVAGLWLEDLHRGLLWTVAPFVRLGTNHLPQPPPPRPVPLIPVVPLPPPQVHDPTRKDQSSASADVTAPSWSWLNLTSTNAATFEIPRYPGDDHLFMHPVERLPSCSDASFVDVKVKSHPKIHRGAIEGVIRLWGIIAHVEAFPFESPIAPSKYDGYRMQRFNIKKRISAHTGRRRSSPRQKESKLTRYPSSKFGRIAEGPELPCVLDRYPPERLDYYCLVISDWRFEQSNKDVFGYDDSTANRPELRCYLILQRISAPSIRRHPLNLGVFKRVGMGAAKVEVVDRFFDSLNKERRFLTVQ